MPKTKYDTVAEFASSLARAEAEEKRYGDGYEAWRRRLLAAIVDGELPRQAVSLLTEPCWTLSLKGHAQGVPLTRAEARKIVIEDASPDLRLLLEASAVKEWRAALVQREAFGEASNRTKRSGDAEREKKIRDVIAAAENVSPQKSYSSLANKLIDQKKWRGSKSCLEKILRGRYGPMNRLGIKIERPLIKKRP